MKIIFLVVSCIMVIASALMAINALENGADFDEDYLLLYGESSAGKFLLYDDGLDIIFDADKADGTYTHWHPLDTEEATKDVIQFMGGISKY